MNSRLREAGLVLPGLLTILVCAALFALGNWQWQRMQWKQRLLVQLEEATKADPVAMQIVPASSLALPNFDLDAIRFRRVGVRGTFEHGKEMHVWAPAPGGPAWSIVTPLRLDDIAGAATKQPAKQATHILIIRGAVPAATKRSDQRQAGQVTGEQLIIGRVRIDRPNTWANAPNIKKNEWFTRDLTVMKKYLEQTFGTNMALAPFFVEAEQPTGGPAAPKPQLRALTLSNRHLEYALTWWGLSATLAGVFAVFAWGRLGGRRK